MAGSYKVLTSVLVVAIVVSTLVMGDQPGHRTERSVAEQYPQSQMDSQLASELQWLREKTVQVLYHHGNNSLPGSHGGRHLGFCFPLGIYCYKTLTYLGKFRYY